MLKEQRIKPRLVRELRFTPEEITNLDDLDLLAIGTRSGAEGLLLIQMTNAYVIPYELTAGIADKATGRSKPITCDFCYTWQRGGNVACITFRRASDNHTSHIYAAVICAAANVSEILHQKLLYHARNCTKISQLSNASND